MSKEGGDKKAAEEEFLNLLAANSAPNKQEIIERNFPPFLRQYKKGYKKTKHNMKNWKTLSDSMDAMISVELTDSRDDCDKALRVRADFGIQRDERLGFGIGRLLSTIRYGICSKEYSQFNEQREIVWLNRIKEIVGILKSLNRNVDTKFLEKRIMKMGKEIETHDQNPQIVEHKKRLTAQIAKLFA